jgi:flagellar assembly protein FliH
MSDHSKFNFAEVFTPGAPHPDDDPHAMMDPADIPVYSQNQLDTALAEARDQGATTASEAAAENSDAVANLILQRIQEEFSRLGTFQDSVVADIHSDAVELALVIGQKLARSLMSREPKAEIEALILEILQQHAEIGSAPKILIRVHPLIAPEIISRIEILKNNVAFTGEVNVLPSDGMGPTDCLVEWADGGAVRDLKMLEEQVTSTVKGYLGAIAEPADGNVQAVQQEPAPPADIPPAAQAAVEMPEAPSVIEEIAAEAQAAAATQDPVS